MDRVLGLIFVSPFRRMVAVAVGLTLAACDAPASPGVAGPGAPSLGMRIDSVSLHAIQPASVPSGAPASPLLSFLYFVSAEDCLDCGDYGAELRLLARRFPFANTALVATGDDRAGVRDYAKRHRVRLVDEAGDALVHQLVVGETPVLAVIGADGRVLVLDHRSGPQSRAYPVSRVFASLADGLVRSSGSELLRPRGGEAEPFSTKE